MMLMNTPRPHLHGLDQNLVSLLKSDRSHLVSEAEAINGQVCRRVDLIDPQDDKTKMSVWIDVHRGFLPIRHTYYLAPVEGGGPVIEFLIEEAVEVADTVWIPVYGKKIAYVRDPNQPEQRHRQVHVLEVDGWREGRPNIQINTGIEDAKFDLWKHLPPGTTVYDNMAGIMWATNNANYDSLGAVLEETIDALQLSVPERNDAIARAAEAGAVPASVASMKSHQANTTVPESRQDTTPTVALVLALAVVGGTAAVALLRRYRNNALKTDH